MQSSSLAFNTKPILASSPANNSYCHSKENCNCTLFAAKFSRLQPDKSITLHSQSARHNRASLLSIKVCISDGQGLNFYLFLVNFVSDLLIIVTLNVRFLVSFCVASVGLFVSQTSPYL